MKIEPSSLFALPNLPQTDSALPVIAPAAPSAQPVGGGAPGFLQTFEAAVLSVDGRTQAASERMRAVDTGQSDDLVGAMLASQEASLSFSMLMQVRNKVMGAVDEIVKLQV